MKGIFFFSAVIAICFGGFTRAESPNFDDYFLDATMRIDYFHTGDHAEETVAIDQIYKQGPWSGARTKLIDDLNYGLYFVKVYDINTNKLIYSQGFCSIFGEYKTTEPARNGIKNTYHESALIPFPKKPFFFVLEKRNKLNLLEPFFTKRIDPASANIINEKPDPRDKVFITLKHGDPKDKVDFVFVAEGYTEEEFDKFKTDVQRFTDAMFRTEAFKVNENKFNVSGVFRASAESGVDEPTKGIFKNTAVSASYNALDLPRYLLVDDNKAMRDIASHVPYDRIIVLTNTSRYGGGGIYNNYAIFTADDHRSESIFLHEFGHAFAYIADEYYNSAVSYNDYYPAGVEPIEENITALLDSENVKWKHLLSPGIEIPTPWGQEEIEALRDKKAQTAQKLQAKIDNFQTQAGKEKQIEKLKTKLTLSNTQIDEDIREVKRVYQEKYKDKIGVFEGAGYSAKGLYRSRLTVGFFTNNHYNEVSRIAIQKVIDHYTP